MKLDEIRIDFKTIREPAGLFYNTFVAVPRGALWQKDLKALWVFKTLADAEKAINSPARPRIQDLLGGYFLPIRAVNGVCALIVVTDAGLKDLNAAKKLLSTEGPPILAIAPTEKSARAAGVKAPIDMKLVSGIWVYKSWNMDRSIFDLEEEDIEEALETQVGKLLEGVGSGVLDFVDYLAKSPAPEPMKARMKKLAVELIKRGFQVFPEHNMRLNKDSDEHGSGWAIGFPPPENRPWNRSGILQSMYTGVHEADDGTIYFSKSSNMYSVQEILDMGVDEFLQHLVKTAKRIK